MAGGAEVADRFGIDPAEPAELMLDFQAYGWISRVEFAGTAGWTLTSAGLGENQRQLAAELGAAGVAGVVRDCYRRFLPHNGELQQACTHWQLRPTASDPPLVGAYPFRVDASLREQGATLADARLVRIK